MAQTTQDASFGPFLVVSAPLLPPCRESGRIEPIYS
jgi:hypothetical protein